MKMGLSHCWYLAASKWPMVHYANMGWFVGDSDIDDIETALLESEKPKGRTQ